MKDTRVQQRVNIFKPLPSFRMTMAWQCLAMVILGFHSISGSSATFDTNRQENHVSGERNAYLAPSSVAASTDGFRVYVACEATDEVLVLNPAKVIARVKVADSPSGLVLSKNNASLYVTCGGPDGSVQVIDTANLKVVDHLPSGYQAQSPVLSPDGKTLFVCNRYNNDISVIDLPTMKELQRIAVPREPFSAAITPDGTRLLVSNHIHAGPSHTEVVRSSLSIIDISSAKVIKDIPLPNGSTLLRDIRISPSGHHAVLAHIIGRFHLPTTQIERGWINSNAASIFDLKDMTLLNTVMLDNIDSGAATPWAVAWSPDGNQLLVTHASTHELSVIDFKALITKLEKIPMTPMPGQKTHPTAPTRTAADVPNDLSFLLGIRQRIKLPGKGPRSISVANNLAWIANYFSDTLIRVELGTSPARVHSSGLGPSPEMSTARLGELYFNDATLCFQGWQACSSCHSHDGRVDGLNWDNLNDGIGNPKNVKSLLLAHRTEPSMWLGVRSDAHISVRAGIRNALFTVQPPEVAEAIDDYLMSLTPMPSPHLIQGNLSPAAIRGKDLFFSEDTGCSDCHRGELYTDRKLHDVGTLGRYDKSSDRFDTPSLKEIWRSAPYLHDGSAATLQDVITIRNIDNQHGSVESLSSHQIRDLSAFLLSL